MTNTGFLIQPKKKKEVKTSNYPTLGDFPTVGSDDIFYKALDTGLVYWWKNGAYELVNPALDANNELCQVSGLPQAMINNPIYSPDYRILNTTACPIDPSDEVYLEVVGTYDLANHRFVYTATLSSAISDNLSISFDVYFTDNGVPNGNSLATEITAGDTSNTKYQPYIPNGEIIITDIIIMDVAPNPSGTKTIIY